MESSDMALPSPTKEVLGEKQWEARIPTSTVLQEPTLQSQGLGGQQYFYPLPLPKQCQQQV